MQFRLKPVKEFLAKYKIWIVSFFVSLVTALLVIIVGSYLLIEPYKKYEINTDARSSTDIGLVLGAGVAGNGRPYKELQARLDAAAGALESGVVSKLILSGDNRFINYDEPTAMFNYLVKDKGISEDKLVRDYAGRSTYESCERAAKVFQI